MGKYILKEQYEQTWKWPANIVVLGIATLSIEVSPGTSFLISLALLSVGNLIAYFSFPQPNSKQETNVDTSDVQPFGESTAFEIGRKKGGIKVSSLKAILTARGYSLDRQGKSHEIWKNGVSQESVPRGKTMAKGTACAILVRVARAQNLDSKNLISQLN